MSEKQKKKLVVPAEPRFYPVAEGQPRFYPTSDLARITGRAQKTVQRKLKQLQITPDAYLVCGQRNAIALFSEVRLKQIAIALAVTPWKINRDNVTNAQETAASVLVSPESNCDKVPRGTATEEKQ